MTIETTPDRLGGERITILPDSSNEDCRIIFETPIGDVKIDFATANLIVDIQPNDGVDALAFRSKRGDPDFTLLIPDPKGSHGKQMAALSKINLSA